MNIFVWSLFLVSVLAEDYEAPRGRSSQRGCVFPSIPPNLIVRPQGKGRVLRFLCPTGSILIGKRFSTCLRARWSSPPPICISKGCPPQTVPQNGRVTETYDGALLTFGCNPGYIQNGGSTIYCILPLWNGTAPTCTAPVNSNLTCNFETDLCGWSHDVTHDFEWKRNKFSTPSGHVGTGPSFDHTLGKGLDGHYMYLEASAPQKPGDITRLFSPVYLPVLSGSCFTFWYHMYGSTIGSLRVYLKEENQVLAELTPVWSKAHETGNSWLQGQIDVPQLTTNFQLVIEGVRGADYMGDIAVDDFVLGPGSCAVQGNRSEPTIQGNVTSATTVDEGGGPEETASQNGTQPTTAAYTREVTTNLSPTTATKLPRIVGSTPPVSVTSTLLNTSEIVATTSKIELSSAKTETTIALTEPQQPDCVIDGSSSSRSSDQNWVISLSNCSTSQLNNTSKTTDVFRPTEVPTVEYRYTTILPTVVDTTQSTPQKITTPNPTLPYIYLSTKALQSATTVIPATTTRSVFPKFTKQTQMTTTSMSMLSTTMQRTTYSENDLSGTTKRPPFIIKNPTTTTTSTTATTSPTLTTTVTTTPTPTTTATTTPTPTTSSPTPTTTTTKTTTSNTKYTSTPPQVSTTTFVPISSNLTATTAQPATTRKATASPGTTGSSTRKSFIYIVPKNTQTVTNYPLGRTTNARRFMSTTLLSLRTSEASTQSSTSTRQSPTKRGIPLVPSKQVTTYSSTTDLSHLFPQSSEEISEEDDEYHSGQNDGNTVVNVSRTESDSSARWQEFPRRPHPRSNQTSGAGVSAIATACSLGALGLVVSALTITYVVRRRKLKQQRYGSNSEMRYITQSEELEFGLPANTDMIKLL